MRLSVPSLVSTAIWLSASLCTATEHHTLTVYQALSIRATESTIAPITYVTWYGAEQESTLSALCWPAIVGTPHDDVAKGDRNWASLLGLKSDLVRREDGWRLTLDLTKLKPASARPEVAGSGREVRVTILESILVAAEKNLLAVGVFDCELSVLGEGAHEDLKDLEIPKTLNPVSKVWGPWAYPDLRKTYPDGDLQALAAHSLTHSESLDTLFLILSSETHSAAGEIALKALLKELLARVGDDRFAQALNDSETLVQERIVKAIGGSNEGIGLFPKTAAFLKK